MEMSAETESMISLYGLGNRYFWRVYCPLLFLYGSGLSRQSSGPLTLVSTESSIEHNITKKKPNRHYYLDRAANSNPFLPKTYVPYPIAGIIIDT